MRHPIAWKQWCRSQQFSVKAGNRPRFIRAHEPLLAQLPNIAEFGVHSSSPYPKLTRSQGSTWNCVRAPTFELPARKRRAARFAFWQPPSLGRAGEGIGTPNKKNLNSSNCRACLFQAGTAFYTSPEAPGPRTAIRLAILPLPRGGTTGVKRRQMAVRVHAAKFHGSELPES